MSIVKLLRTSQALINQAYFKKREKRIRPKIVFPMTNLTRCLKKRVNNASQMICTKF